MQCPKCGAEGVDRLMLSPCHACGYQWLDTEGYVYKLTMEGDLAPALAAKPEVVLDIGCGDKGVIAQHHWESVVGIARGYACDIHVVKDLPAQWTKLVMDAENLVTKLGAAAVDFTTSCGTLEHMGYSKALRVLRVIERVTKQRIFITCSAVVREVMYKVERDGNKWHAYRSFWDARTFELLGYTVDRHRMHHAITFCQEVTLWGDPQALDTTPWPDRVAAALKHIRDRRCSEPGCTCEPAWWDSVQSPVDARDWRDDVYWCLRHAEPHFQGHHTGGGEPLKRWYDNPEKLVNFPRPSGRPPLRLLPEDPEPEVRP